MSVNAKSLTAIRAKQEFHRQYAEGVGLANGAQEWWESVEFLLAEVKRLGTMREGWMKSTLARDQYVFRLEAALKKLEREDTYYIPKGERNGVMEYDTLTVNAIRAIAREALP